MGTVIACSGLRPVMLGTLHIKREMFLVPPHSLVPISDLTYFFMTAFLPWEELWLIP